MFKILSKAEEGKVRGAFDEKLCHEDACFDGCPEGPLQYRGSALNVNRANNSGGGGGGGGCFREGGNWLSNAWNHYFNAC